MENQELIQAYTQKEVQRLGDWKGVEEPSEIRSGQYSIPAKRGARVSFPAPNVLYLFLAGLGFGLAIALWGSSKMNAILFSLASVILLYFGSRNTRFTSQTIRELYGTHAELTPTELMDATRAYARLAQQINPNDLCPACGQITDKRWNGGPDVCSECLNPHG